jgi:uncharacterized protein (TIGR03083 family)
VWTTEPVLTAHLLPEVHQHLLELLAALQPEEWQSPTACGDWRVKDVALHLLGGQLGVLSRLRDQDRSGQFPAELDLVSAINLLNERWVAATQGFSVRVLQDLLAFSGPPYCTYLQTLDPWAPSEVVSWAGDEPAPGWLEVARQYTEQWHHQQHLRDAVDRPGLTEPRFLHPVLASFMHALPRTFQGEQAPVASVVRVVVEGASGDVWDLVRGTDHWQLAAGGSGVPTATVRLSADTAWRLFTKGLDVDTARPRVVMEGDGRLGQRVLAAVAIIA